MNELSGKRVLVLGLGLTGLSMARWLRAHGAVVRIADSRATPPNLDAIRAGMPDVAIDTGAFRRASFERQDLLAVSPGVPLAEPEIAAAIARGVPAVGDIELFARGLDALCLERGIARPRVLAITGSNGKSTVTEMTGALCRAAGLETLVAGNIGLPVLDALGAKRMVVGHTVQAGGITEACDGKVRRIDVGLSSYYGGPIQALEIKGEDIKVLKEPQ